MHTILTGSGRCSRLLAFAGAALSMASVMGQSVDALLDKLVDKGILTVREANQLREESDKNFATAYSAKSGTGRLQVDALFRF